VSDGAESTAGKAPHTAREEGWAVWVPGVARLRSLGPADVRMDLVSGLAVTSLLIPHGMAYAELAGVPAVTGLYTTVAALIAYAVFGPSRILMLGPDSSLAPLIAAAIVLVGVDDDPEKAIATVGMLALLSGAFCILAGIGRLGTIAELLSRPVRVGYLNGLAIVMVVSQLPKLFGFSASGDTTVELAIDFVEGLVDGLTNGTALALGLVCLAVIVGLGVWSPKAPGVLVAVGGATVAVAVLDLTDRGVSVIGDIPGGFPRPAWPGVDAGDVPTLLASALGIAVLTLSDTTALSKGFADKSREEVDPNLEIVALGIANMSVGFFRGFPISASTTRTTLADATGGRSQLVGIVGAVLVLALLIFGGGLVEDLPSVALAAVVIAAAFKLFDLPALLWLLAVRRTEFVLSVAAMVGVVAIGVLEGIVVAIVLSMGNFVRRVWRPYDAVLARVDGRKGYHDVSRHPEARQIPGLVMFRFDAPLFFANADHFVRRVRAVIQEAPGPVQKVVVVAEPMSDIDTTGAEVLARLLDELDEMEVSLAFAGLKGPVKDRLRRYGLYDRLGDRKFHSTLGKAIDVYVSESGVPWVDWTDKPRPGKRTPRSEEVRSPAGEDG
jgi:high affinity sulfate transporter 1